MDEKNKNEQENTLSCYSIITDRKGKKHRIYSARFKDLQTITDFTTKYEPGHLDMYALAPVLDDDGQLMYDDDGNIVFDTGFQDDLFEIIGIALDHRETREEIEQWLDFVLAEEIIVMLLNLSSFKKKQM